MPLLGPPGKLAQRDGNVLNVPYAYLIGASRLQMKGLPVKFLRAAQQYSSARRIPCSRGLGGVTVQFCYIIVLPGSARLDLAKQSPGKSQQSLGSSGVAMGSPPLRRATVT